MTATTLDATRRDFAYVASGAMASGGVAAPVWPFVDQIDPTPAVPISDLPDPVARNANFPDGAPATDAGRVRKGLAPQNLAVPPYSFLNDTRIKVG